MINFSNLKKYIRLIALLIISLVSIGLYASVSSLSSDDFIKSISLAIFSTGLVMFVYEYIYTTRGEKYFEEIIGEKVPIYLKMKSKGIEDISDSFEIDKYQDKIVNSKNMTVVMNDGKSFIGHNSYIFKRRFKLENKETNFVLLDPQSDFIAFLNKKNGKHDEHYYQRKLLDIIKEILFDFDVIEGHKINVYVHGMFNTMSVLRFDDVAMISLYRLSPGKSIVPHIEFRNVGGESEFIEIVDDVKKLIEISTKIDKENYKDIKDAVYKKIDTRTA
ncbi:hypothetical protein [Pseudoalteromonas sp. Angola-7]|uniref:hypothetical protein n=1 Tax=Pseudoalteromonas sp. Angola-7 TaxID=3025336 RepID=UPI0023590D65|nr:hypothetical protein [Pseudoalteromonas sp. Angola-7]MDC9531874.1 hypothetical protein [Pseudoalteromonas sp. Angola-7]